METAPPPQEPTHRRIMGLAARFNGGRIRLSVFPRAEEGLGIVERDVTPDELPGVDLEHTDANLVLDVIIDPIRHELIKVVHIHRREPKTNAEH